MTGDALLRALLDAAGAAVPWMGTFLLHSTVLLAAASILDAVLRDRAPRVRTTAWRTAMVGGVLTATFVTLGGAPATWALARPAWTLPSSVARDAAPSADRAPPRAGPGSDAARSEARAPDAGEAGRPEPSKGSVPATGAGATVATIVGASGAGSATAGLPAPPSLLGLRDLPAIAGLIAALGSIALLVRRVRAERALATVLARRVPVTAGPLSIALGSVAPRGGARVRLSTLDGLSTPVAFGVLRPEICVPPRADSGLGTRSLRALLAHEMAHIEARDPAWARLSGFLAALLWFQPLHALAVRRLESSSEALADAAAVALEGPDALASSLVEVAGWTLEGRTAVPLSAMARPGPGLVRRVERLLAGVVVPERDARGARIARTGAAVACVAAAFLWAPVVSRAAGAPTAPSATETTVVRVGPMGESVDPPILATLDVELRALEAEIAALERAAALHPNVSSDLLARLRTQARRLAERAQALRDALRPPPPPSSR